MLGSTLLTRGSFFLLMFGFYFALGWTPRLPVQAGLSAQQGITGGVLLDIGGIVGGLLASRLNLGWLGSACMLLTAFAMAAFGYVTGMGCRSASSASAPSSRRSSPACCSTAPHLCYAFALPLLVAMLTVPALRKNAGADGAARGGAIAATH